MKYLDCVNVCSDFHQPKQERLDEACSNVNLHPSRGNVIPTETYFLARPLNGVFFAGLLTHCQTGLVWSKIVHPKTLKSTQKYSLKSTNMHFLCRVVDTLSDRSGLELQPGGIRVLPRLCKKAGPLSLGQEEQARKARRCDSYLQIWNYQSPTHWLTGVGAWRCYCI